MVAELYPTEEALTEACIQEDDMEFPEMGVIGEKKDSDDEDYNLDSRRVARPANYEDDSSEASGSTTQGKFIGQKKSGSKREKARSTKEFCGRCYLNHRFYRHNLSLCRVDPAPLTTAEWNAISTR